MTPESKTPLTDQIMRSVREAINADKREAMYAHRDAAENAIRKLELSFSEGAFKWIPMGERKPPFNTYVLVHNATCPNYVSTDTLLSCPEGELWVHDPDGWTHWMPLPAPPAKEGA